MHADQIELAAAGRWAFVDFGCRSGGRPRSLGAEGRGGLDVQTRTAHARHAGLQPRGAHGLRQGQETQAAARPCRRQRRHDAEHRCEVRVRDHRRRAQRAEVVCLQLQVHAERGRHQGDGLHVRARQGNSQGPVGKAGLVAIGRLRAWRRSAAAYRATRRGSRQTESDRNSARSRTLRRRSPRRASAPPSQASSGRPCP